MINNDKTMQEIRKIKERLSLERLARTTEEQKLHSEEVLKRAEERLGRPIKAADYSKCREEELARV